MADAPPTEIQTLIDDHIKGFNAQDAELFFSRSSETTPSSSTALAPSLAEPERPGELAGRVARKVAGRCFGVTSERLSYEWASGTSKGPMPTP